MPVVAHVWLSSQQQLGYCTPACEARLLRPAFLCRLVCGTSAVRCGTFCYMDWLACCGWYAGAECVKDQGSPCVCLLSLAVRPDSAFVAVAPVSGAACTGIAAGAVRLCVRHGGPTAV